MLPFSVRSTLNNARYFDRSFLTEPDLDDWRRIAIDIQNNISDSIIHQAISSLPDNIYDSTGKVIEDKLASRLNDLDKYAESYYRFLAKNVDVVGTNERRHQRGRPKKGKIIRWS